jgi:SAM-dependent methyltransferase
VSARRDIADHSARSFDDLIAEAEAHPTIGWDFSWLGDRMHATSLPWDYTARVVQRARRSPDLLDLGTGGGEWLAALPDRPVTTVATEGWKPNIAVAARRLRPLGVPVIYVEGAPDNILQDVGQDRPALPFSAASFHLVVNRHESFVAKEVARILVAGGCFITQQLGDGRYGDFRALFDLAPADQEPFTLSIAVAQLERAGLDITDSAAANEEIVFSDVGALAWYLRMIPWIVPGFSIGALRERLGDLHERAIGDGGLRFTMPGFYVVAVKQPHH